METMCKVKIAYLAVDEDGEEWIYDDEPDRNKKDGIWIPAKCRDNDCYQLPNGSIEKLLGYKLTWKDNPVKI